MLLVYDHCKYFIFFSAGVDFMHHNLTYKYGPRAERVKWQEEPLHAVRVGLTSLVVFLNI